MDSVGDNLNGRSNNNSESGRNSRNVTDGCSNIFR